MKETIVISDDDDASKNNSEAMDDVQRQNPYSK